MSTKDNRISLRMDEQSGRERGPVCGDLRPVGGSSGARDWSSWPLPASQIGSATEVTSSFEKMAPTNVTSKCSACGKSKKSTPGIRLHLLPRDARRYVVLE